MYHRGRFAQTTVHAAKLRQNNNGNDNGDDDNSSSSSSSSSSIVVVVVVLIIAFKCANLRREPSPTRTLKWLGRSRVQTHRGLVSCHMPCHVPPCTKRQLSY